MAPNDVVAMPDLRGHFGKFGGRFVPEALMAALDELDEAFRKAMVDPNFLKQLRDLLTEKGVKVKPSMKKNELVELAKL